MEKDLPIYMQLINYLDKSNGWIEMSKIKLELNINLLTMHRYLYVLEKTGLIKVSRTGCRFKPIWSKIKKSKKWDENKAIKTLSFKE